MFKSKIVRHHQVERMALFCHASLLPFGCGTLADCASARTREFPSHHVLDIVTIGAWGVDRAGKRCQRALIHACIRTSRVASSSVLTQFDEAAIMTASCSVNRAARDLELRFSELTTLAGLVLGGLGLPRPR